VLNQEIGLEEYLQNFVSGGCETLPQWWWWYYTNDCL